MWQKDTALLKASSEGEMSGCVLIDLGQCLGESQGRMCIGLRMKELSNVTEAFPNWWPFQSTNLVKWNAK